MIVAQDPLPNPERATFRPDRTCGIARLVLTARLRVQASGLIQLTVAFGRRTQFRETNLISARRTEFINRRNLDPVCSGCLGDDLYNFAAAETHFIIELADQFLVRTKHSCYTSIPACCTVAEAS